MQPPWKVILPPPQIWTWDWWSWTQSGPHRPGYLTESPVFPFHPARWSATADQTSRVEPNATLRGCWVFGFTRNGKSRLISVKRRNTHKWLFFRCTIEPSIMSGCISVSECCNAANLDLYPKNFEGRLLWHSNFAVVYDTVRLLWRISRKRLEKLALGVKICVRHLSSGPTSLKRVPWIECSKILLRFDSDTARKAVNLRLVLKVTVNSLIVTACNWPVDYIYIMIFKFFCEIFVDLRTNRFLLNQKHICIPIDRLYIFIFRCQEISGTAGIRQVLW